MPFVSVVIPHYNDLDNLATCLSALRCQNWPKDLFEIVVADNNSKGGTTAVEQIAPDIRVVPAPEQGAGPARNAAVAVARGDILAFIDSDCVPEKDWLAEGIESLKRFDYAGGTVITTVANPLRVTPAEAYELVFAFNFKKYIEKDKFSGAGNLFVPKSVFEKVGGFQQGVSEDIDWCWRANGLGYRLGYAEKAIVSHSARTTWPELRRKWDRVIFETIRLEQQRPGWRKRWLWRTILTAGSPLPHAFRVLVSPQLKGVRARMAGLAGLVGIRLYRAARMFTALQT